MPNPIGRTPEARVQRTPFFDFFTTDLPFAAAVLAFAGGAASRGLPAIFLGIGLNARLAATLACFTASTGGLGAGLAAFAAGLAAFGAALILGAGLATLGAALATFGAALGTLGAGLGGFAAFFTGLRTASLDLTAAIGSGAAANGGMGNGAKTSATGGFGKAAERARRSRAPRHSYDTGLYLR